KVKLRRHGLSGAANLVFAWQPLGVDHWSGRAHSTIQSSGQIKDQAEIFLLLQTAAARDNHGSRTQVDFSRRSLRLSDHATPTGYSREVDFDGFDSRPNACAGSAGIWDNIGRECSRCNGNKIWSGF